MLQVVRKTYNGVTVGYVVGWWFFPRRWYGAASGKQSFRSFRNGVLFKTEKKAIEFRDKIEKRRKESGVKFEAVK